MPKKSMLPPLTLIILINAAILFYSNLPQAAAAETLDKTKIAAMESQYTTTVSTFNGAVSVKVADKPEMTITLMPGENIKVPKGALGKKGVITWKDIAEYETTLVDFKDPYSKWFIENLWRDRLNRALAAIEAKLKIRYPDDYQNINVPLDDVTQALGMVPPIGFLTGQRFVKIENAFGGRVANVDPKVFLQSEGLIRPEVTETLPLNDNPPPVETPSS